MMQTLLTKGRTLGLVLIVAALLVALNAGTAVAKDPFSADNPWAPPDPIVPTDRDIVDGRYWYETQSPSRQLEDYSGATGPVQGNADGTAPAPVSATTPAPAPVTTKAQLPATGGNGDAMLFALIAGALLVVGGLPTAGRWIVRKASR